LIASITELDKGFTFSIRHRKPNSGGMSALGILLQRNTCGRSENG
jgi:hypothetical protein